MVQDKSEFLRARVSERTKKDFEEICQELGKTATEQLRELIEGFVGAQYGTLQDAISVQIYRPADYQHGAWRVTIKLRKPNVGTWQGTPIPFAFPKLPNRRIHSDPEYLAVVSANNPPELGGQVVGGEWRGHIYSNGIEEQLNPTPIEEVRDSLHQTMIDLTTRFPG